MAALLILLVFAVAGPSGALAWSESEHLLKQRQQQIATLREERDALRNQVALVHPDHADPDIVGEKLRRDLNLVHPDEVVLTLPKTSE
ncbi:MAG: septum formation initiator family protein [Pontixanthobacter sp.]